MDNDPISRPGTATTGLAFREAFGESLRSVLDLESWRSGEDLEAVHARIAAEVEAAVRQELRLHDPLRRQIFPRLRALPGAPPNAGPYKASQDYLRQIHEGLLFTGAVEACDATQYTHETLPLAVTQ